ncbi:MAG: DUF885 family protein [Gemmatimonadaceae bacterium]|nr:DUF885 family protein [Gemmatimonadaceae bacterium]
MTLRPGDEVDRFLQTLFTLRPVDATFIGHHTQDHRYPDWSPAGHEAATAAWASSREALRQALGARTDDEVLATGNAEDIDALLAISHCDVALAELRGPHVTRGNPSLASGEAAFAIIGLLTRDFLPASQRASWLMQRLRGLPGFLAGAMSTLREAPVPEAWRRRALREAAGLSRLLETGVPLWCQAMALEERTTRAVLEAAQVAGGGTHAFAHTLEQLRGSGQEVATCGEETLGVLLARGHWESRSLDDLWSDVTARFEVEQDRLGALVRSVCASDVSEVQARLAARHPSPEGYYEAFARSWDACRAASAHLVTWPNIPVSYVPIPAWTRMAAPDLYYLFYRSPAPLDAFPQPFEYVVTPIDGLDPAAVDRHLRACNDSVIKLNHVVHHGALGHHVQNWYAARAPYRIGRIAAADCASRIAMLQGGTKAEGWACYATDLMDEAGFLTADERVAEQHTRVRMLARALVDIELHTSRTTFENAVRCYAETVGMSGEAARAEVVKNSMFPGTAMMYWLGTQGIHDLRAVEAARAGAAFSLAGFHDRLLGHGSIPVAVSGRLMQRGSGRNAGF